MITNNLERMRISSAGGVGIGTSNFNNANPEQLVVDAGQLRLLRERPLPPSMLSWEKATITITCN